MKIFKNRQSAGQLLAKRLKNVSADLVLGIPRGGVVVAAEIAKELKLPLDIVVVRKIGAPWQSELALGAVDPDGEVSWDHVLLAQFKLKIENLKLIIEDEMQELQRREGLYRPGKEPLNVQNKIVILTDDGIATGSTVLSAIKYLKRHGAKVILAVPIASKDSLEKVREIGGVGEVRVLEESENFGAVGEFYAEFLPVSDEKVIQLLS